MIRKLRLKFICINMTIVTLMLAFIMGMVVQFTKQNMEQASIQMLNNLASNPLYLLRPNDSINVSLPYFSLRLDNRGELLEVVSSYYHLSDRSYLDEVIDSSSGISGETGELAEHHLRFMRVTTPADQFLIFVDMSHEVNTLDILTRNCILIGIISFFVFLGISIFLANWAVKPVDLAWSQQKQFIADASHELKTPLTVILTNAELLQSPGCSPQNQCRFSENISAMAAQMRNLVENLLELSRLDNDFLKTAAKKIDFSALTEHEIYLFEPLFFEQNLKLETEIASPIWVTGSDCHLKQLLEILLDNARKYAAPETTVQVRLQRQKACCELAVSSQGETISPEDLKHIFKRFYRVDKSRTGSGSYGLGLSIAEGIVTAHHGKIRAESKEGINTFFVRIPTHESLRLPPAHPCTFPESE